MIMPNRVASEVATVSPHSTHADLSESKCREPSVTLQLLQYGPVVHGLQTRPFLFAHDDVSGEDASGQRLRSKLSMSMRQYPGKIGSFSRVVPTLVQEVPGSGHGWHSASASR